MCTCVILCWDICIFKDRHLWSPEEGIRSPGTGVSALVWVLGLELRSSAAVVSLLIAGCDVMGPAVSSACCYDIPEVTDYNLELCPLRCFFLI